MEALNASLPTAVNTSLIHRTYSHGLGEGLQCQTSSSVNPARTHADHRFCRKTQVSDGEYCSSGPESPNVSPRFSKNLALNTALGKEASYCCTPKGEIWLSGFQSPIPQSGLMAATRQEENIERRRSQAPAASSSCNDNGETLSPPASYGAGKRTSTIESSTSATVGVGTVAVGDVVTMPMIDRVVLLGRVGEGATGVVYRAFDLLDLRLVAVKVIPINNQEKRRQLVHEVSSLYDRLRMRGRPQRAAASEIGETDVEASGGTPQAPSWIKNASKAESRSSDPHGGSKHILELIDVFATTSNSTVSLVVEYMDGGSLQVQYQNKKSG